MGTHHKKRNRIISTQPIDLAAIFLLQSAIIEVHLHKQTNGFRLKVFHAHCGLVSQDNSQETALHRSGQLLLVRSYQIFYQRMRKNKDV